MLAFNAAHNHVEKKRNPKTSRDKKKCEELKSTNLLILRIHSILLFKEKGELSYITLYVSYAARALCT